MNDKQLKTVVITGAGSGIGKEIALLLSNKNFNLVLTDINESAVQNLSNELNNNSGSISYKQLNVLHVNEFEDTLAFTLTHFGKLDIWINNAGIMPTGHFTSMNPELIAQLFEINLHGAAKGIKTASDYFIKNNIKGQIINIASVTSKVPLPYAAYYSASKSALITLCDALRIELTNTNIEINCILPGFVNTKLTKEAKKPLFPPMIEPEIVAKAVYKTICKPKANRFVPWYLGPMSMLQPLLSTKMIKLIGATLKITNTVKPD